MKILIKDPRHQYHNLLNSLILIVPKNNLLTKLTQAINDGNSVEIIYIIRNHINDLIIQPINPDHITCWKLIKHLEILLNTYKIREFEATRLSATLRLLIESNVKKIDDYIGVLNSDLIILTNMIAKYPYSSGLINSLKIDLDKTIVLKTNPIKPTNLNLSDNEVDRLICVIKNLESTKCTGEDVKREVNLLRADIEIFAFYEHVLIVITHWVLKRYSDIRNELASLHESFDHLNNTQLGLIRHDEDMVLLDGIITNLNDNLVKEAKLLEISFSINQEFSIESMSNAVRLMIV